MTADHHLTGLDRPTDSVVPEDEWDWLENCLGLISPVEGDWLAARAREVPEYQTIVEIGSHTGLSTCWLAAGSRQGNNVHVFAIDPWPDPGYAENDDPFDLETGDAVYRRFYANVVGTSQQVRRVDYRPWVIPWRMTSMDAAASWTGTPIGLLFIDAIHTFEGTKADVDLWAGWVPVGGWLALNDYWADPERTQLNGPAFVAKELLEPSGEWTDTDVIYNTWVGRRASP